MTIRGTAWVDGAWRRGCTIETADGVIAEIVFDPASAHGEEHLLLPGLIDVHVHGGAGADFMDGTAEAVETITRFHLRHGTTSLAATTLSASGRDIERAVRAAAALARREEPDGAGIEAIHLEGPFLSPRFSGAQDRAALRAVRVHELERWIAAAGDLPLIMTIAPELEGALDLIERFRDRVIFSIGHSSADFPQAIAAVEAGARHFTHLFNAMSPFHHREPGVVGAALASPGTTVELIADGEHLHHAALRFAAEWFRRRAILVTDAMRACGMPDGEYKLHEYDVTVADGAARLADGRLAGSVLTMIAALQNMVELAGVPLEQALPFATTHPARLLGLGKRKGKIVPGFDADLILVNRRFEIVRTWVGGREVAIS
jgi:N-acetylglucosamine-6-phosphate deacetylase